MNTYRLVEKLESLGERVFRLVMHGDMKSQEFQALMKWYGEDRLVNLYRCERKKRKLS